MLSEEEDTEADTLPSHYAIVAQCGCGKVYTLLQWFCLPFGWHDHEGIDEYGDTLSIAIAPARAL